MRAIFYRTAIIGALVLSVGSVIGQQATTRSADARSAQIKQESARITALMTERRDLLREREQLALAQYRQGLCNMEALYRASRDAIQADLDLARTHTERLAQLQQWVDKTQEIEKIVEQSNKVGTALKTDVLEARAAHLEAEIELERERKAL